MSQGTSRLVQFGGGVFVLVLLPIFIVIALIFASLSAVEEAAACTPPVTGTGPSFAWPVGNHQPSVPFDRDTHAFVDFPATSGEEVHAVAAGRVTSVSGDVVKVDSTDSQTPRPTNGSGRMLVTYSLLTTVAVHEGDQVAMGGKIGSAGATLRIQITLDGEIVDPMDFLREQQAPTGGACGCGAGSATGRNNEQKAFNYFVSVGYKKEWAAGIVGNMVRESGVDPKKLNGGAIVSSADVALDGRAWGIVQWYPPGGMITPSRQAGVPAEQIDSLEYQLEFVWKQLEGTSIALDHSDVGDMLKRTTTAEDAAFVFARYFEIFSVDESDPEFAARESEARDVLNRWGGQAPAPGSGEGGSTTCTGTVISIDGHDYAFPLLRPKNDISNGYSWPCPSICHHDGTPAFDLARRALDDSTAGTPVVAITSGHIENFNNFYAGIEGCQSFQLVGDDGWWYWYGHQANASIRDGQTVTAGQPISQVGERACTGNGSYPHLHIDRGSPKGHYGGVDCCRDPGMVPLINQLYAALPDAG
jgi:murein DD-endopeptidase MepM/ murein hydrolase activator NlpD